MVSSSPPAVLLRLIFLRVVMVDLSSPCFFVFPAFFRSSPVCEGIGHVCPPESPPYSLSTSFIRMTMFSSLETPNPLSETFPGLREDSGALSLSSVFPI
ncbi:hypothetical protein M758_UG115800 [Ceratodon purpureus]|nr:hypothetical protein M758_UG115800 [Ceratodon purpureus]